jgi:hypothetical protein
MFAPALHLTPLEASPLLAGQAAAAAPASHKAPAGGTVRHPPSKGLTGFAASSGSASSGGGFSPSLFLVLLIALAALACLLSELLRLPSTIWRPIVFVSLQERPG